MRRETQVEPGTRRRPRRLRPLPWSWDSDSESDRPEQRSFRNVVPKTEGVSSETVPTSPTAFQEADSGACPAEVPVHVVDALEFDLTIADSETESGGEVEELPVAQAPPQAISPHTIPVRAPVLVNSEECVVATEVVCDSAEVRPTSGRRLRSRPRCLAWPSFSQSDRADVPSVSCPDALGWCQQVRHCRAR